jgi:hypothetical protein
MAHILKLKCLHHKIFQIPLTFKKENRSFPMRKMWRVDNVLVLLRTVLSYGRDWTSPLTFCYLVSHIFQQTDPFVFQSWHDSRCIKALASSCIWCEFVSKLVDVTRGSIKGFLRGNGTSECKSPSSVCHGNGRGRIHVSFRSMS